MTKPAPKPKPIKPCNTCRWSIRDQGTNLARCHANPPQIRLPFDNIAAWPVVPEQGGGCGLHQEAT
jgi:hypothetical protein